MSKRVTIQGDRAAFPGNACVHCIKPGTQEVQIVKVKGYAVRKVAVPFCDDCAQLRSQKSRRQILFERAAVANSILLALAAGARTYIFASNGQAFPGDVSWFWGLLLGTLVALIVFGTMYLLIRPWAGYFRGPETQAALRAVTIKDFDWQTTTLEFADEEYAAQFERVNHKKDDQDQPAGGPAISNGTERET